MTNQEREARREASLEAHRDRVNKCTQAYNNMNHYSTSPEQKKMYEMMCVFLVINTLCLMLLTANAVGLLDNLIDLIIKKRKNRKK